MIIGHLPAGYVLSRIGYSWFCHVISSYRPFMFWGMFGSIVPDLDMLYFHLIDHRSTHHHKYFSHYPSVWLSIVAIAAIFSISETSRKKFGGYALLFSVSAFLHLILDTVVGDVWWFAPFVDQPFALATVPALYKPWWLNFILHWSFLLELSICFWAVLLWRRGPNPTVKRGAPKMSRPLP